MYKHILVATDGSEFSGHAIRQGAALARTLGAKLSVITVTLPFHIFSLNPRTVTDTEPRYREDMRKRADQYLAEAEAEAKKNGLSCTLIQREHEHPWESIISTAEGRGCDLIVMASHGRSGLAALVIGSQTVKVLRHSVIPVLIARPPLESTG
jgi:nucleotide-binding universal stress UspA family protein